MEYVLLGVLGAAGFSVLSLKSVYNRLVALDERCNTAFADVDVLMKHRHTLLPGLLETVKGYLAHEKQIFNALIDSRNKALEAQSNEVKLEAEAQLGQNIMSVVKAAENNPELKASSHFQNFRNELIDIENRVTASRRFYNVTVEEFNATARQFPGKQICDWFNIGRRQHFDLGAERMLVDEPVSIK